jgi:hypothetical protein
MSGRGSSQVGTPSRPLPAPRLVGLAAALLGGSEGVRRLVDPALRAMLSPATGAAPWDLPLVTLVAGCCAAALALCWTWLVACATVVAVDALRHGAAVDGAGSEPVAPRACPRWVRTLVLAALGLAVGAGPALADSPGTGTVQAPSAPGLVGLALPDRLASSPAHARPRLVRVHPGDSLWAIAGRQLPPSAPDAAVDRAWRRLAAANTDRVDDPDLIFPGTVLRVPDLDTPTRKELP